MPHRWLAFFSIAALGLMVFILFWYRNQPIEIQTPEPSVEYGSLEEPTVTFINPAKGAENPRVTIVEFGDFQCEACAELAISLDVLIRTFPDDVRIVWKNMPNESTHPTATPAAIAAHCAEAQGAFWQYHDALFLRQSTLSDSQFMQIAQDLKLDSERFQACYEERETLPIVKKDYEEGLALGIASTPTIYIGKQSLVGATTTQELIEIVANLLEQK